MDFLFEKWKLYGDQCLSNLSLLPPPTGEPLAAPPSPGLGQAAAMELPAGQGPIPLSPIDRGPWRGQSGTSPRPHTSI